MWQRARFAVVSTVASLIIGVWFAAGCALIPEVGTPDESAESSDDPFRHDPFFLDDLLAWEGPRHGTLGPTGRRFFAERRSSKPGLRGSFGYIHSVPGLRDPIALTFDGTGFTDVGETALESFQETWRPSHQESRYQMGDLSVREQAFITEDDVAMTIVRLSNEGDDPVQLNCRVTGGFATNPALDPRKLRPIDLGLFANVSWLPPGKRAGMVRMDGIPFLIGDPAGANDRTAIALRGGRSGSERFERPTHVEIPVDLRARRIHLLGHLGLGPAAEDVPDGTVVARFRLVYEDGVHSRDLQKGDDLSPRAHARNGSEPDDTYVLTLPLDSTRHLRYLRFEKVDSRLSPLLFAATVEDGSVLNEPRALVGTRTLSGVETNAHLSAAVLNVVGDAIPMNLTGWDREELRLIGSRKLEPGEEVVLRAVHALADDADVAQKRANSWLHDRDPLLRHRTAYHAWFDRNCPRFESGEPLLDKLWWYRWYVARHNLAFPQAEGVTGPVFYAGRRGEGSTRLTAGSAPFVVAETRWLRDQTYAQNQVRAALSDGAADSWLAKAAWDVYKARPDRRFLAEITAPLARELLAAANEWDEASDKRPELASYVYGNARALSAAWLVLGEIESARRLGKLADTTRESALQELWSDERALFVSAPGQQADLFGFYPWNFGLPPDGPRYARSFDTLFSPAGFHTPVPFSIQPAWESTDAPRVQPGADSLVLGSLGTLLTEYHQHDVDAQQFRDVLLAFARFQFEEGDLPRPMLRQSGDAATGVQSGCPDFFHSTWIDLIYRYGELADLPRPWLPKEPADG